jgi:hypothetical protein
MGITVARRIDTPLRRMKEIRSMELEDRKIRTGARHWRRAPVGQIDGACLPNV